MGTPGNKPLGSGGGTHSWFWDAENALGNAYEHGKSEVASAMYATVQELDHIVEQVSRSSTWAELRTVVYPILGEFSYNFGVAVGLAESIGDLAKGLFQLQRMLVLAALYEEASSLRSHPGRSFFIEVATDAALFPAKAFVLALNATGAWPTLVQDMKEADDQVRGIINEIESLISHPIDSVVSFTTKKWGSRWNSWQECVNWWTQCNNLYNSGDPKKMYEAGVMMGKLVGNIVLTVLAIVSMYGLAVRAAQLAVVGGRVALGLVSLEAAQAEALAAETALAAARTERAAVGATGDQAKIAQAARAEAAAAESLKAARLQRSFAQLKQRAPKLFKSLKNVEELPPAKPGAAAGAAEDAEAGSGSKTKSPEERQNKVGGKNVQTLDPNKVRFSQKSVSYLKKRPTGNYTYDDIVSSMKRNGWNDKPVDVVQMPDGELTSVDNTRIAAAREAGIDIQANVHDYNEPLDSEQIRRFSDPKDGFNPTTWGDAVSGRIDDQGAAFRNTNPMGSPNLPTITGQP